MSTGSDVDFVRRNAAEPGTEIYSDEDIMVLVDEQGLNRAVLLIWREKAARYSGLVDVNEGGASRKMSQMYDRAIRQVDFWQNIIDQESVETAPPGVVVKKIVRS